LGQTTLDPIEDTFAFGNETLFAYRNQHRDASTPPRLTERPYTRRCFVLCRAVMQFHQFAEFNPQVARLSEAEYRKIILQLSRIPVSHKRKRSRLKIPGFSNLQEFSQAYPALLQENLGNWWPTYIRFGNWRMAFPFPRSGQEKLSRRIQQNIDQDQLVALYITRFRPLNHCLVVHSYEKTPR